MSLTFSYTIVRASRSLATGTAVFEQAIVAQLLRGRAKAID
jgi:hypothetical protein